MSAARTSAQLAPGMAMMTVRLPDASTGGRIGRSGETNSCARAAVMHAPNTASNPRQTQATRDTVAPALPALSSNQTLGLGQRLIEPFQVLAARLGEIGPPSSSAPGGLGDLAD